MKNKNKKKKGFTLIELIAVIAILAILGAVLIPNLSGFKNKAKKSNILESAKVVTNAVQNYDAEHEDATIDLTKKLSEIEADATIVGFKEMLDLSKMNDKEKAALEDQTIAHIVKEISAGKFTVTTEDDKSITITIK